MRVFRKGRYGKARRIRFRRRKFNRILDKCSILSVYFDLFALLSLHGDLEQGA